MHRLPTILIVDDDEGHTILIRQSFAEVGLHNPFVEFCDGQAILDFLHGVTERHAGIARGSPFLLLLDIRLPKVDGVEVLRRIKQDRDLQLLPVIMLSTTDDPAEIERCHRFGCSAYVQKPVNYDSFAEVVRWLGNFTKILTLPRLAAW